MLVALGVLLGAAMTVGLSLVALVMAPAIDNRLGILVGQDLRRLQAHQIDGVSLATLVRQRAGLVTWSAAHRDDLRETDVECRLPDGQRCCWEVSHYRPRPWVRQDVYFTPTNRAAATLVPELIPRGRLIPGRFPEQPCAGGAVHDMAEPERARELFERYFRKHHPRLHAELAVIASGARSRPDVERHG